MKLAKASEIRRTLARAKDVGEVNEIRAKASALAEYERLRGAWKKALQFEGVALDAHLESGRRLIEMKRTGKRHRGARLSAPEAPKLQTILGTPTVDTAKKLGAYQQRAYRLEDRDPKRVIAYQAYQENLGAAGSITLKGFLNDEVRTTQETQRRERAKQRAQAAEGISLDEHIIVGDFREHADRIPDGSLSLIFTDPPYLRGDEEVLPGLADFAARKLTSGGSILFYIGHLQLPAAFDAFEGKLRHWWTCACVHAGSKALMREYGIRVGWKPILWFVKDTREDRLQNIVFDTVSGEREKDHHEWQQAEKEALYWIESLCPKDGIVCDPFLGGGTTAAAAKKASRKWIGFEIDPDTASIASKRVAG